MASISLCRATVRHGGGSRQRSPVTALDAVDLDIVDGELVTVVGVSGSGKTTLLRLIAGLERAAGGSVLMDGVDVTTTDPGTRDVAMVFQVPHLLPHRSVGRNVAFPLEVRRRTVEEIRERVGAEARALHIEALLERSPDQLAAGEAQLVQIARALVRVPRALLLDEPLARLDAPLRERMRRELRTLQRGYGVTTVFTTNDPTEAMAMGDRLVVLDAGRVLQVGPPIDVYREPETLLAAQLTGPLRVGRVERGERVGERPDGRRLRFDATNGRRIR